MCNEPTAGLQPRTRADATAPEKSTPCANCGRPATGYDARYARPSCRRCAHLWADGGDAPLGPTDPAAYLVEDATVVVRELNAFRRDLLAATALYQPDGPRHDYPYGMGLKRALEGVYGRQVNHGQLYPGLSDLVEHGLLRTRLDNQRTSYYEFTDRGRRALTGYAHYLASAAAVAGADVAWPHQPVEPVGDTDADLSIRGDGRRSRLPGVERDGDREHGSGREPDEEGER